MMTFQNNMNDIGRCVADDMINLPDCSRFRERRR